MMSYDVTITPSGDLTVDLTATSLSVEISQLGESSDSIGWADVTDKPATFTPSPHSHVKADISDLSDADYATAAQGGLADTATQPGDLATVATSGAYSDLSGKPTIPVSGTDFVAKSGGTFTGNVSVTEVTETVYSLTGTDVDPANGTVQTLALSANVTLTESLATGQAVRLLITNGDTYTVTWPAGIEWVGGSAPTLTAKDLVTLEKIGSDLIGYFGTGVA